MTPAQQSVSSSGCGETTRSEVRASMGGMPSAAVAVRLAEAMPRQRAPASKERKIRRGMTMVMAARSVLE